MRGTAAQVLCSQKTARIFMLGSAPHSLSVLRHQALAISDSGDPCVAAVWKAQLPRVLWQGRFYSLLGGPDGRAALRRQRSAPCQAAGMVTRLGSFIHKRGYVQPETICAGSVRILTDVSPRFGPVAACTLIAGMLEACVGPEPALCHRVIAPALLECLAWCANAGSQRWCDQGEGRQQAELGRIISHSSRSDVTIRAAGADTVLQLQTMLAVLYGHMQGRLLLLQSCLKGCLLSTN